ncbi:tRNA t(6)A37-methylthiotransferase [hydrothermal vent metagenome]|uniref:tRNA t(6)A37-methylthiotransferase n=1 Tax=hydrothermal vent metagenome TaxID=652676 RepID=A0A3B1B455_9ZZZZ
MRVHLKTLGCRLNEAELETWSRDFLALGHELTQELNSADLVVVNSCAVTAEAVRKSRKLIRRAQKSNPKAKLVVSGCYASLDPADSAGIDLVVHNKDKDRLVEIATQQLDLHTMPATTTEPGESPLLARGRQRAFLKIQDGCRYHCTFCIVTLARGEERSRQTQEIVNDINALHAEGIQEVVLTGVHIGGYGSDINSNLLQLIKGILTDTKIPRIRLGSIEPWDLLDNFWSLFQNSRLMPHLHLPLQSGADSVLQRMARRCSTAEFRQLVADARHNIPNFNVTTDVIVGFPGETEEEWQQTLEFVEEIGFSHLHIFAYSPRPGTKAAELPDQVDRETSKARSKALHTLGHQLRKASMKANIGQECSVLIEGKPTTGADGQEIWGGYTPNFLRVTIRTKPGLALENCIRTIRLEQIADTGEHQMASLIQPII